METGRHQRPVTPLDQRICLKCNSGEIEDEFHAFMNCEFYQQQRYETVNKISQECPNFNALDKADQFNFLMNSSGKILKQTMFLVKYILVNNDPRRS